MNTIVSFKYVFDLYVVLCKMHSRCSLQIKLSTNTMLAAVQADHGRPLYLTVFQYIVAVEFVQQFIQTSFAKHVVVNSS